MKKQMLLLFGFMAIVLFSTPAWAVLINFDDTGLGHNDAITNAYAGVTFNGITNTFPQGGPYPVPGTVPTTIGGAGLWNPAGTPAPSASPPYFAVGWGQGQPGNAGILMTFDTVISDISLTGLDYGDNGGDLESMTLAAYDTAGNLIGWDFFTGTAFDVSGSLSFAGMKYVSFNYSDTQFGFFGIDDVEYTPMTGTVPEPATMLLLGTGLIGLAVVGRKRFH